jgi:hypothetical protein
VARRTVQTLIGSYVAFRTRTRAPATVLAMAKEIVIRARVDPA